MNIQALCENFKDLHLVFSGIFFFGEFPKIALQIVPLTQENVFRFTGSVI